MNPLTVIKNADQAVNILGAWPCLHDSEIIAVRMSRTDPANPVVEVDIRGGTGEFSFTFVFCGVTVASVEGFNQQNVIATDMDIIKKDLRYEVKISSLYGAWVFLECQSIEIKDIKGKI